MTHNPILTKTFLALPIDGTFIIKKPNSDPENSAAPLDHLAIPYFNHSGKEIQVYMSERVIKSGIEAFHKQKALKATFDFKPAIIKQLLPTFSGVYGGDYEHVPVEVQSTGNQPQVSILADATRLQGSVNVKIKNPLNPKIRSAILNVSYDATVQLEINNNFNFSGTVKDIDMNVTGFRAYFKSQENTETLTHKMKVVDKIITQLFNQKLNQGMKLPISLTSQEHNGDGHGQVEEPDWTDGIEKSSLIHSDHFFYADVNFNQKTFTAQQQNSAASSGEPGCEPGKERECAQNEHKS